MHNPAIPPSQPVTYSRRGWVWSGLGLVGVISALWASGGTLESLWVDELHSSWCVSDRFSKIAERARAGNQSSLFFWLLFGLVRTLGTFPSISQEWLLRSPAVVSYVLIVVVCLYHLGVEQRLVSATGAMLTGLLVWLLLDRVQLFYATEARVYGLVQLVSLLGWLAVGRMQTRPHWMWCWCGLSVMIVFLHITAILAVATQILWGTLALNRPDSVHRMRWAAVVAVVALGSFVGLLLSAQVWAARGQWDQFAGEASLQSFIGLLPLMSYAVPVIVCRGIDACIRLRHYYTPSSSCRRSALAEKSVTWLLSYRGLWWLAMLGPWVAAWCITACDVAPIFHRRFVIVSAVPLVLVAAMEVGRIQSGWLRWLAVAGVAVSLIVSQGTLDNWRAGYWIGWQRWEGWRQATNALSERVQSGDVVWCAAGLVEANTAKLPLDDSLSRYLSFPLRGAYQVVTASGQRVEPRGLLSRGGEWAEQLLAAANAQPTAGESSHWIVYRGSQAGLQRRLAAMRGRLAVDAHASWRSDPPQAFGLVSIVRVVRTHRS